MWYMKNIKYNGQQILSMKLNGQYPFFDICKHIPFSLKMCCKFFKISENICKTELNHSQIQRLYDYLGSERFIETIKNSKEFNKYIFNDVASLSELYYKYDKNMYSIDTLKTFLERKQISEFCTLGSLMYKVQKKIMEDNDINYSILPPDLFEKIRSN